MSFFLERSLVAAKESTDAVLVTQPTSGLLRIEKQGIRRAYRCRFQKSFHVRRVDGAVIMDGMAHRPLGDTFSSAQAFQKLLSAPPITAAQYANVSPLFARKPFLGTAAIDAIPAYHKTLNVCPSNVTLALYEALIATAKKRPGGAGSVQREWLFHVCAHDLRMAITEKAVAEKIMMRLQSKTNALKDEQIKAKREPLSPAREAWYAAIQTFSAIRGDRMHAERYLISTGTTHAASSASSAPKESAPKPPPSSSASSATSLAEALKKKAPLATGYLAERNRQKPLHEQEKLIGPSSSKELVQDIEAERKRRSLLEIVGHESAALPGGGDDEDGDDAEEAEEAAFGEDGDKPMTAAQMRRAEEKRSEDDIANAWKPTDYQIQRLMVLNRQHYLCVNMAHRPIPKHVEKMIAERRKKALADIKSAEARCLLQTKFGWSADGEFANVKTQAELLKKQKTEWTMSKDGVVSPVKCILYEGKETTEYPKIGPLKTALRLRRKETKANLHNATVSNSKFIPVGSIQNRLIARFDSRCFYTHPDTYTPIEIDVPGNLVSLRTKALVGLQERNEGGGGEVKKPAGDVKGADGVVAGGDDIDAAAASASVHPQPPPKADPPPVPVTTTKGKGKRPAKIDAAVTQYLKLIDKYGKETDPIKYFLFMKDGRVKDFKTKAELENHICTMYPRSVFANTHNPAPPPEPKKKPPPAPPVKKTKAPAKSKKKTESGSKRKRASSDESEVDEEEDEEDEVYGSEDENTKESEDEEDDDDNEDVDLCDDMSDDEDVAQRKREVKASYKIDVSKMYQIETAYLSDEQCAALNERIRSAVQSDQFLKDPHAYAEAHEEFEDQKAPMADRVFLMQLQAMARSIQPRINKTLSKRAQKLREDRKRRQTHVVAKQRRRLMGPDSDAEDESGIVADDAEIVMTDSEDALGNMDAKADRDAAAAAATKRTVKNAAAAATAAPRSGEPKKKKTRRSTSPNLAPRKSSYSPLREIKISARNLIRFDESMVSVDMISADARKFLNNLHDLVVIVRTTPSVNFRILRMDGPTLAVIEHNQPSTVGKGISRNTFANSRILLIIDDPKNPSVVREMTMPIVFEKLEKSFKVIHSALSSNVVVPHSAASAGKGRPTLPQHRSSMTYQQFLERQESAWLMLRFTNEVRTGGMPKDERLFEIPAHTVPSAPTDLPSGYSAILSGTPKYVSLLTEFEQRTASGKPLTPLEMQTRLGAMCLSACMTNLQCTPESIACAIHMFGAIHKHKDVSSMWSVMRNALLHLRACRQQVDAFVATQPEMQASVRAELEMQIAPLNMSQTQSSDGVVMSLLLRYTELDVEKLLAVRVAERAKKTGQAAERMLEAERRVPVHLQKFIADRAIKEFVGNALTCGVCMEAMCVNIRYVPKCMHRFCTPCVEKIMQLNGDKAQCPSCRGPMIAQGPIEPMPCTSFASTMADHLGLDFTYACDPEIQLKVADFKILVSSHRDVIQRLVKNMDAAVDRPSLRSPYTGPVSQVRDILVRIKCEEAMAGTLQRYDIAVDAEKNQYVITRL